MNHSALRIAFLVITLVGALLACSGVPAADSEHAALEAAGQRWVAAANTNDVAVLTASMTDDVALLDEPAVRGRDAAIRALRATAARGRLAETTRELTISGDFAWRIVALTQTRPNGDVQSQGQALEIWKRVNGEWRLHRRMVAGIAPAELPTRPSTKDPVLDRPRD